MEEEVDLSCGHVVLPVTFGCAAAAHGLSFWRGFLLGALANGVLRFLWRPFGM